MNAIILTDEELDLRIEKKAILIVQKMLGLSIEKQAVPRKTNLDMAEAIEYLYSIGYKCSKSSLSKFTMKEEIPFSKFGRRVSFNTDDLARWVETRKSKTVRV